MALAPNESEKMSSGKSIFNSSCSRSKMVHFACFAQAVKAIYSASIEESATVHCFGVVQDMDPPVNKKQKPMVGCQVSVSAAQSESLYFLLHNYTMHCHLEHQRSYISG